MEPIVVGPGAGKVCSPEALARDYEAKKDPIRCRLEEFRRVRETADDVRLFEELTFCILAAGSSAKMGIEGVESLRPRLMKGSPEELASLLRHVRFHTTRARYIVHARYYLNTHWEGSLRKLIEALPDHESRRAFFAENPDIKGIGYKEASHFLRNIGFTGYCILDKHIVGILHDLGRLRSPMPPSTRARYLEAEAGMQELASDLGISVDEMDLLLWSYKTGVILK